MIDLDVTYVGVIFYALEALLESSQVPAMFCVMPADVYGSL